MKPLNTGTILLMAYPNTFVKPSGEFICKITPYLGIGTKDYTQAGHSALCLINNKTGEINYYDFGRYITPDGFGRVRNKSTDTELHIPITACFKNNILENTYEILRWLRSYPEKTHGDGDLYASILYDVDYEDACNFIKNIHIRGSIPYGIFIKQGSNCSRFVADTVIASTTNPIILKRIVGESRVTPSPLGVVNKGRNSEQVFIVGENEISEIKNISWIKNMKNFLEKKYKNEKTIHQPKITKKDLHYLSGIGHGAYFNLRKNKNDEYIISRLDKKGITNFEDVFIPEDNSFDITKKYFFVYDSNCEYCHINQNNSIYRFNRKRT